MMKICRQYPGAEFWTNIFTPYPGSPVMKRAFELGIDVPKTLEGWADFFPRYTVLPWLKGDDHTRVQNMREYMRVAFHRIPIGKYRTPALSRFIFELISKPARWRLDHHVYAFRWNSGLGTLRRSCSLLPRRKWMRISCRPNR